MEIKEINGNLLDSDAPCICQQVNCQGVMGSGVAKAIRNKWPKIFDAYKEYVSIARDKSDLLGNILPLTVSDTQRVINYFSQLYYGYDGHRYTDYEAIFQCLEKTALYCSTNHINRIAMPYKMGSARGGADWDVIMAMIKSAFKDSNITIEIWRLDADSPSSPTLTFQNNK